MPTFLLEINYLVGSLPESKADVRNSWSAEEVFNFRRFTNNLRGDETDSWKRLMSITKMDFDKYVHHLWKNIIWKIPRHVDFKPSMVKSCRSGENIDNYLIMIPGTKPDSGFNKNASGIHCRSKEIGTKRHSHGDHKSELQTGIVNKNRKPRVSATKNDNENSNVKNHYDSSIF